MVKNQGPLEVAGCILQIAAQAGGSWEVADVAEAVCWHLLFATAAS